MVAEPPPGVDQEISEERDEMFKPGRRDLYFEMGAAALRAIRVALLTAGIEQPRRILDFPCGHGRVMRMLRAEFCDAELTGGDLNTDGIEFCARKFGSTPVQSGIRAEEVELGGRFDLVWCGSLLTHLDRDRYDGFFSLLTNALDEGGVLVFTAFGRHAADRIRRGEALYGLGNEGARKILSEFDRDGFGYSDYEGQTLSGMTLTSPSFVCDRLESARDLRLVGYTERGWHGHQDVIACTRTGAQAAS